MPGEAWQLHINGGKVIGRADSLLYDHCHKDGSIQYWIDNGRIIEGSEDIIDWESHAKAMKAFGPRKHWVTKHFSGWAGSGVNMHKWGYRTSAKCPRCEEEETTSHVLNCASEEADEEFWEAIEPLAEWLVKKATASEGEALLDHALAARDRRTARVHPDWPKEVQEATQLQSNLGYRAMIEGLPVLHWRYMAQLGNTKGDSIEKGLRWTSALIRKNWEVSWSMWVARNDLVHKDGETRNTLVIHDINQQVKRLQKEGSRCRDLFRDDRKFFKTPYWKLAKKTEEQKIRYIETARRLLDESRRSSQQTLDGWSLAEQSETESDDDDTDDDDSAIAMVAGTTDETNEGPVRKKQMTLRHYFNTPRSANNPMTIDGTGGASREVSDGDFHVEVISEMPTQPSAGGGQPTAGWLRPSAGRLQPSAGVGKPSAGLHQPSDGAARDQPEADATRDNPTLT